MTRYMLAAKVGKEGRDKQNNILFNCHGASPWFLPPLNRSV